MKIKYVFCFVLFALILFGGYYRYEYIIHDIIVRFQKGQIKDREEKLMNENLEKIHDLKCLQEEEGAWYTKYHYIAHGGGGIEGKTYSNSFEAMDLSYENGLRVFDVDMTFTSDSVLVLRHDWTENLEQRGQTMLESGGFIDRNGHVQHHVKNAIRLDFKSFMSKKIYKSYTPMSCKDLIVYMQRHPDLYVATDMKDDVVASYQYLVDMIKEMKADSVLERIIANVYDFNVYNRIMKIYPFKNVTARQHYVHPNNYFQLAEFCVRNNIHVVNMSSCYVKDEGAKLLMSKGIYIYVAVVDYISDMEKLKVKGFSGACTNWLKENEWEKY